MINKRADFATIRRGLFVMVVCFLALFTLHSFLAGAKSLSEEYVVGEKVLIDLPSGSYKLRISTPSEEFIQQAAGSFAFVPEEPGFHKVEVSGDLRDTFSFDIVERQSTIDMPTSTAEEVWLGKSDVVVESDPSESFDDFRVVAGKPVLNRKVVSGSVARLSIPYQSSQVSVTSGGNDVSFEEDKGVVGRIINLFSENVEKDIVIPFVDGDVEVTYVTPAPKVVEKKLSPTELEVEVSAAEVYGYANIFAGADVNERIPIDSRDRIQVYWVEEGRYIDFDVVDSDNDGLIDGVSWVIPHLSTQTFVVIIPIVSAQLLDSQRIFVRDVFRTVGRLDGVYETIPSGNFVRVRFEKPLTFYNDITVYARGSGSIEVFERDSNVALMTFQISGDRMYKQFLSSLSGWQDEFDLRVIGSVDIDFITDPSAAPGGSIELRAQGASEQNNQPTQNLFPDAVQGSYPAACGSSGDRLSCDDGIVETATSIRTTGGAGFNGYGGVNITSYNTGVVTCQNITEVILYYEFWGTSSQHTCTVGVDANGGASWSDTGVTCSGTAPGVQTLNVTDSEAWTCSNFFGPSGTRALAKAQAQKTAAAGSQTWNFDVLYFNVSYTEIPVGALNVFLNAPSDGEVTTTNVVFNYTPSTDANFVSCNLWDNSTGVFALNQSNATAIVNGTPNTITKTYGSSGTYLWNVQCCDDSNGCEFALNNRSVTIDNTPPTIDLISPANFASSTSQYGVDFVFNVTEDNSLQSCSLIVDGETEVVNTTIVADQPQTINPFLTDGFRSWSVNCTDAAGNTASSGSRTIAISVASVNWTNRFYETFNASFTSTDASINLYPTRDGVVNNASVTMSPTSLINSVTAISPFIGGNGLVLESGTVDFSGVFASSSSNKGYVTWKVYVTNWSGDTLICQHGNDNTGGTRITGTSQGTYTGSCSNAGNITLKATDQVKLEVNVYNSWTNPFDVTHLWDGLLLSYVEFVNVFTPGLINVSLIAPSSNLNVVTSNSFDMLCEVSCIGGTCTGTEVFVQYNTSATDWVNISSTGNLILGGGEVNPVVLGSVNATSQVVNVTIDANLASTNNIRCVAVSSSSSSVSTQPRQVVVSGANQPPVVTLLDPANASWSNNPVTTLLYNASDDNGLFEGCSLYVNGAFNQSNQSAILNGLSNNFSLGTLSDGSYNWSVNCTDTAGFNGTDGPDVFYIDTGIPSVGLVYPAFNETVLQTLVNFNFSVSDNLADALTCNLTVDGSVIDADFSASTSGFTNRTNTLGLGTHFWNVSCVDYAGNFNVSETRNFTIQDFAPSVNLITANESWFNVDTPVLFYNTSDNNYVNNCSLFVDGVFSQVNSSALNQSGVNNFTLAPTAQGPHNWTVSCTDDANLNTTAVPSRVFYIDLQTPGLVLNLPVNDSTFLFSTINFSFTATENLGSLTCNLTVGPVTDNLFSAINGSLTGRVVSDIDDGSQFWNVTCWDNAGNTNVSESRLINVTEYPSVTLNTADNFAFNTTSVSLAYTPYDNSDLASCELFINGALNQTNSSAIVNGAENTFNLTLGSGYYNWSVECIDIIGLRNSSANQSFIVDVQVPSVDLNAPVDGASITSSLVNFNFTASDDLDPSLVCNVTVNNVVQSTVNASNGVPTVSPVVFSTAGLKFWNVTCFDDAGNSNVSLTRNFTLFLPPSVNLTSPVSGYAQNSPLISLFYNVTDGNDDIVNATLVLNGLLNITNQSAVINGGINNFTFNLSEGFYVWNVNVSDSTSQVGTALQTRNFTLDFTAPLVNVGGPLLHEVVIDNNITFNFSVSDNLDSTLLCNLSVDDFVEYEDIPVSNGSTQLNYLLRNDGNYSWFLSCVDDAGNVNVTQDFNFTVEAPPIVTLDSPANNLLTNQSSFTFSYYANDSVGITQCDLYIDGVLNQTDSTVSPNALNSFNPVTGISEGTHNWTVNCTDPDFNTGQPPIRLFSRDLSPPVIQLNYPLNGSGLDANSANVLFNWTATDALDILLTCDLTVNGIVEANDVLVTSGVANTELVSGLPLGLNMWNVTCWDTVNNTNVSLTWEFNRSYPDLQINRSSIVFSDFNPSENQSIEINASVYNLGAADVSSVVVQFFNGDPSAGGVQVGVNQSISVSAGSFTVASVNWNVDIGSSTIFVVVDPPLVSNGSILEVDETNNIANRSLTVESWHFLYGDLTASSRFVLDDNLSSRIQTWNRSDLSNVNLYAADYESSIEWDLLYALGKNLADVNVTDDFAEVDSLLGMSNYSDSVSNLYLDAGVVNNTDTYVVFSNIVDEVPVATSINASIFRTGILWDASDDSNGQFDSSESEDLVFVSKILQDTAGSYEVTDYEMRIPARLREYLSVDTKSAAFYVELR